MAINFEIYESGNAVSKTVTADFLIEVLADPYDAPTNENVYYIKFTTAARDTDNLAYPPRIAKSLDSLALNREKQSASNTSLPYTSIDALVNDYLYDYIKGHIAGQFSTSVAKKSPMKFT